MTATLLRHQVGIPSVSLIGKKLNESEILQSLKKQLVPPGGIIISLDLDSDLEELKKFAPALSTKIQTHGTSDEVVAYIRKGTEETVLKKVEEIDTIFA
jgi:hypothetical protein